MITDLPIPPNRGRGVTPLRFLLFKEKDEDANGFNLRLTQYSPTKKKAACHDESQKESVDLCRGTDKQAKGGGNRSIVSKIYL